MLIKLPSEVIEWASKNWQEIDLNSVEFEVVDRLPFGSSADAMTWRGRVLIRREWIEPALSDLREGNTLNARYLWAVILLAFHEPVHVIEQRKRSWWLYLARYVWQWVTGPGYRNLKEEIKARDNSEKLGSRFFEEVGRKVPSYTRWRSETQNTKTEGGA